MIRGCWISCLNIVYFWELKEGFWDNPATKWWLIGWSCVAAFYVTARFLRSFPFRITVNQAAASNQPRLQTLQYVWCFCSIKKCRPPAIRNETNHNFYCVKVLCLAFVALNRIFAGASPLAIVIVSQNSHFSRQKPFLFNFFFHEKMTIWATVTPNATDCFPISIKRLAFSMRYESIISGKNWWYFLATCSSSILHLLSEIRFLQYICQKSTCAILLNFFKDDTFCTFIVNRFRLLCVKFLFWKTETTHQRSLSEPFHKLKRHT